MKQQLDRNLYGMQWPHEEPILNIPGHLQRTMLGLGLLHEFAVERKKDSERIVLENAMSAIKWMSEQTALMIDAAEIVERVHTSSGETTTLESLMRRINEGAV